jgi:hypothetical protein
VVNGRCRSVLVGRDEVELLKLRNFVRHYHLARQQRAREARLV